VIGAVAIGNSSATLAITGTAAGTVRVAGASAQSLAITGTAVGTVRVTGSTSQALAITGTAAGAISALAIGNSSATLAVTGTAAGTVRITGSSSQTLAITGSATGTSGSSGFPAPTMYLPLNVDLSDSSANGFAPTGTPTPTYTTTNPPPIYSAYHNFDWDGGDSLGYANVTALNPGSGDFTFTAFVRPTTRAGLSSYPSWFSKGFYQSDTGATVWFADMAANRYGAGASNPWIETNAASATLSINTWVRMTVVRSGSTVTLYQGTASIGTFSASGLDFTNTYAFIVGGHTLSADQGWQGGISDFVYIKGTALTTGQIASLQTATYASLM
jgi:hypothetical protein